MNIFLCICYVALLSAQSLTSLRPGVSWRPMPSLRRWHSAPPSDARRQHSCRPVHSPRLYHRRQAVVYAEWTPTESRQVLTLDLAQTSACSLILSRIDYCDSVLHDAPSSAIQKLQRVQNNAARIVLQAPRRSDVNSLLQTLHWLPVEQRIKLSWPCWRSRLSRRHLRSIWASKSRCAPVHATLDRRPFHCCACNFDGHHSPDNRSISTAAPMLWNSLQPALLNCNSLSTYKIIQA